MKKKRTGWIILIIVLVILAGGLGLFLSRYFKTRPEKISKTIYALVGETIQVEELVSMENYKSATISPELILVENFSDAKVSDDGQTVNLGYTACVFEVIVYVTDEDGEVIEERVRVVPGIED